MPDYRRSRIEGGCYFFTVNLLERRNNDLLIQNIDLLRESVQKVRKSRPFIIEGFVVLPDHLHCVWTLPKGDSDYSTRWRLIKTRFARGVASVESRSAVRQKKGERGIWQRRFWEHTIRDEADFIRHMDYLHYNPVKHGYVAKVSDWPFSTFSRLVEQGVYPASWGAEGVADVEAGE